ncbi:hypothetical protein O6H91_13G038400 [Diphasiastrum complanatum]|uniref:Uncharacterized protein n=2 Tax=Diphasiastrum complanatum TaxID=34168 RepID=A0ACC2BU06_DIPCM|nr:hypothetical protein O6H91_13G038400 [Diphasiastrum complanatum]KAJ7533224.1 hypothetical protein O6H91_13G038400 [Diphasiastrum complanatum]
MADLLSELERFEQEMKELGSEPSSSLVPPPHLVAQVPLPVLPPPPPPHSGLAIADSRGSSGTLSSSAASPPLPSNPPTQTLPTINHTLPSPPLSTPIPPPGPSLQLAPPVSVALSMPWLNNGAGSSGTAANSPAAPLTTTSPQFTFLRGNMSYPASVSNIPSPSPPQSMPISSSGSYYARVPSQPPLSQPQHYQQYHNQQQYQPPQQQQHPVQPTVVQAPQYHYQALYQSVPEMYHHPQQQQAQQLFQKDAQTITPEALEHVKAALASGDGDQKSEAKRKAIPRKAAGQTWEDPTLADWPENDYRLFCGDLGNEVNDEVLTKAFSRFSTFNMAKVVRDKRTGKTKGYGFVSFASSSDLALALKEMNGKYVGNRPIKLRKSTWKERTDFDAYEKHKTAKKPKMSKKNVLHK